MSQADIINLRLTNRSRVGYLLAAGLVFVSVSWYAGTLPSGTDPGLPVEVGFLALLVFAFLWYRTARRGFGEIQITEDGLLIDTNITLGLVTWDNFEDAFAFQRLRLPYLGIRIKDTAKFIDSRKNLKGHHDLDIKLVALCNQAGKAFPQKGMEEALKLLDNVKVFSALPPTSATESELMQWNREHAGWDLCLPLLGVIDADKIPDRIKSRRPVSVAPIPASTGVTPPPSDNAVPVAPADTPKPAMPDPEFKICPMCAEQVRAAAKICRFCHYSFESGKVLNE